MAAAAGRGDGEREERKPTREETPDLRKAIKASESGYRTFWSALSRMPALSHWPNRPEPFDPSLSEIYRYLLDQCRHLLGLDDECGIEELEAGDFQLLGRIFQAASKAGVIRFDQETKLWQGAPPPWRRYRSPSAVNAARRHYQREARARAAETYVCEACGEWFQGEAAFRAHVAEQRLIELGYWPETQDSLHA
jgi:hypothetical protein